MLLELYTNKIKKSNHNYLYIKTNIFNLFLKLSKNEKEIINFYKKTFNFMLSLNKLEDLNKQIEILNTELLEAIDKHNNFIEEQKELIFEHLNPEVYKKYKKELHQLSLNVKNKENKIKKYDNLKKELLDYYSLNFDAFIYFLKNYYKYVQKDFIKFLKNVKGHDRLLFILIYYLVEYNLDNIIKDVIINYNINKNEVSLIIESKNIYLILELIKLHSNKILKFDIIYQTLLSNSKILEETNIKSDNIYINYIINHIKINS